MSTLSEIVDIQSRMIDVADQQADTIAALSKVVSRLMDRVAALEMHCVDREGFWPDGYVAAGVENLEKALASGRLASSQAWRP